MAKRKSEIVKTLSEWLVLLLMVALATTAGYKVGTERQRAEANRRIDGLNEEVKQLSSKLGDQERQHGALVADYNNLTQDYNKLRDGVLEYIDGQQYTARNTLSCSSTTYGINNRFTSTYCY